MSSPVVWQRSSFCGTNACISVGFYGPVVCLRNTASTEPPLMISREEWDAFVKGVKAGEFDA